MNRNPSMQFTSNSEPNPSRRAVLTGAAALGCAHLTGAANAANLMHTSTGKPAAALGGASQDDNQPWFKISLAEWSLHRALGEKKLENLDFPRVAAEYGIYGVEYVNSFFKDRAGDFGYLRELDARCKDAGVQSVLIMVDGEGSLADEDDSNRRQAIENHFRWISAAAFLGCHCIRVNAHGGDTAERRAERAADSLRRLAQMGEHFGIDVVVENHGGLSSDGGWLSGVMKRANHPRVGTLPDFGNFNLGDGKSYDRYQGVTELMPFAKAVSAKSHDFDASGAEIHTDYLKMMGIVKAAGYRGFVGVEYEGGTHSEHDGIVLTKRLLEKVRAELA
ncbi:MAG: sugar phosphate isomerase/epimerase family protein [Planctomycetota bacterium]